MKKIITFLLCVSLLVSSMGVFALAKDAHSSIEQIKTIQASDGRVVQFTIKNAVKGEVSKDDLRDIADSNPDSTDFIIYEKSYAKEAPDSDIKEKEVKKPANQVNALIPTPITLIGPVIKNYSVYDVLQSDRFMASCAKGETKTVTSTISASLEPSYSGTALGGVSLKSTITYSISTGTQLVGPPESSTNNCREYRCKFYENRGTWAQSGFILGIPFAYSGSFNEPSYYYSYSRDLKI